MSSAVRRVTETERRTTDSRSRHDRPSPSLEEHVRSIVATWPPLTDDQCARVASLLGGGPR